MKEENQAESVSPGSKGYLFKLLGTFGLMVAIAITVAQHSMDYRGEKAVRFDQMKESELVVTTGLSRSQRVYLKLGYLEFIQKIKVGLLGNHQIQYFSGRAFEGKLENGEFFNFWGAAASLEDHYAYLRLMEQLNILPDLTIVHFTTPNNDNGAGIIGLDPNMLPILLESGIVEQSNNFYDLIANLLNSIRLFANNSLDYITLLTGLSDQGAAIIVDRNVCKKRQNLVSAKTSPEWWRRLLPNTIESIFFRSDDISKSFCTPRFLNAGFLRDGSTILPDNPPPPAIDEFNIDPITRKLKNGAEDAIVKIMQKIIRLLERNSRRVVFLIPPVFESERQSIVDAIATKALAKIPPKYVIDHRHFGRGKAHLFVDYDHANNDYYTMVVNEIQTRGILGD